MCIFCERAKASLDDPLAGLDGGGEWGGDASGTGTSNRNRRASWSATLQQKREAERCEELKRKARLPVTVITGFLGSGKTTFVNHLLSARHGRKLAVIENEFGEVAIDDALLGDGGVERGDEAQQVILMPNGCMCCRVRGDLVDALKRLIVSASNAPADDEAASSGAASAREARQAAPAGPDGAAKSIAATGEQAEGAVTAVLDGIILECSGLDELAPVLQTFFADPFVQEHVRLDAVVCLCDSPRLLRALVAPPPPPPPVPAHVVPSAAAGGADTKGSACAEEASEETSDLGAARPAAATATLVMSQLALSDRVLLNKSDLVTPAEGDALVDAVKEHFPGASVTRCERGKVDVDLVLGVDSFSLDKALEMDQHFADILADREESNGPKDIGNHGDDKHHHHDHHNNKAEGGALRRGDEGTGHDQRHRHGHDRLGAQSVGVELAEGPIDWAKFTSWLKSFLEKEGDELIWRLKGVLWTTAAPAHGGRAGTTWGWGAGRRTVVQGLYGHVESEVSEWPAGATRVSRLVFIGDLSTRVQDALRAGVRSCLAAPRARPPPPKSRPPASLAGRARGGGGGGFASRIGAVKFGGGGSDDIYL
eukprot:g6455.t1